MYPKHFKSKLTDAASGNSETIIWLDFALAFEYMAQSEYNNLSNKAEEVRKLIQYMINNTSKFSKKSNSNGNK